MRFFLEVRKEILVMNRKMVKKHRENSDSASSLPDDVFSDGFNSPDCAKILDHCLKSIELQAKELFVLYEDTKNSHKILLLMHSDYCQQNLMN